MLGQIVAMLRSVLVQAAGGAAGGLLSSVLFAWVRVRCISTSLDGGHGMLSMVPYLAWVLVLVPPLLMGMGKPERTAVRSGAWVC